MLSKASVDFDLACLLRECALQYDPDLPYFMQAWQNISRASLEYVQVSINLTRIYYATH